MSRFAFRTWLVFAAGLVMGACAGCRQPESDTVQGYVEGEYVYVAAPKAGALESLAVRRGQQVSAGESLFALEPQPEKSIRDEAALRVAQARANLEDAKKGRRPTEIESLEAQLKEARAGLVRAASDLARMEESLRSGVGSTDEAERARATRDQTRAQVARIEADLKTARLGARYDQIAAAEANLEATDAALAKAEWELAQKRQAAPQAGLVFDTLYREDEWIPAGRPVVVLLPPENVKVRAFVPEPRIGAIRLDQRAELFVDGRAEPVGGRVNFISPRAEFTPPVIYSRESRAKLVFLVEINVPPAEAAKLHPGQPVDVRFGK